MRPEYDTFFASFADVQFAACLDFQSVENERPFYPPSAEILGEPYRKVLSYQEYNTETAPGGTAANYKVPKNEFNQGGWEQRHVGVEKIMQTARKLTKWELTDVPARKRWIGDYLPA